MKSLAKIGLVCISLVSGCISSVTAMREDISRDNDCSIKLLDYTDTLTDSKNKDLTDGVTEVLANNKAKEIKDIGDKKSGDNNNEKVNKDSDDENLADDEQDEKSEKDSVIEINEKGDIVGNYDDNINKFFAKYKDPEVIMILDCSGLTQTIHLSNAEKALVNIYWDRHHDLNLLKRINKWVGISYGCTLAGANVGTLARSKDIFEFNNDIDSMINHLQLDRQGQHSKWTKFKSCLFNCCLCCAKCHINDEDLNIIRDSQFDSSTPQALEYYIETYFPHEVLKNLVFLQSGKDGRRFDPDYHKCFTSLIDSVNNRAKLNNRTVIRKNVEFIADSAADIADEVGVPVVGKIAKGAKKIISKKTTFETIDNSTNWPPYKKYSEEFGTKNGALKIILRVTNKDIKNVNGNFQVMQKFSKGTMKVVVTMYIPELSHQIKNYDFTNGYNTISEYLNQKNIKDYLTKVFEFLSKTNSTKIKE